MIYLSKNLGYLRKSSGKKQIEIGRFVQKGGNTVWNWEHGVSNPNIEEIVALSNFFGVSLQDLVLTDMEPEGIVGNPSIVVAGDHLRPGNSEARPYATRQTVSEVNEDDANLNWLLLQEVRRNSEKLDQLIRSVDKPIEEG